MRAEGDLSTAKFIIASGDAKSATVFEAVAAGVDGLIATPFQSATLTKSPAPSEIEPSVPFVNDFA